jgi:hypothetical protein
MTSLKVINPSEFTDKSWTRPENFLFAQHDSVCPLTVKELAKAMLFMPISFIKDDNGTHLVGVQGFDHDTNYFVAADGTWRGRYLPDRYSVHPFTLARDNSDKERLLLCIDESSGLIKDNTDNEPFFGSDGEISPFINSILDSLKDIESSRAVTVKICESLIRLNLIKPWELKVQDGETSKSVEGLYCIDESTLISLDSDQFISLREIGALPLIYCQLLSMQHAAELARFSNIDSDPRVKALADEIGLTQDDGGNALNFDHL